VVESEVVVGGEANAARAAITRAAATRAAAACAAAESWQRTVSRRPVIT